jgi:hypothetical protein
LCLNLKSGAKNGVDDAADQPTGPAKDQKVNLIGRLVEMVRCQNNSDVEPESNDLGPMK